MSTIRVVWGSASAPTKMSSYDAALAQAGIENYNLVSVSSIIPAGVDVEAVGTAPDLGPAGERLTVVEARATTAEDGSVSAGLGWMESVDDGPGLFYEVSDGIDSEDVESRVLEGLEAGAELRDWNFDEPQVQVEHTDAEPGTYTTAVVLAAYGESEPIV